MKNRKSKKHPATVALEKWYESEDGKKCLEGSTSGEYLKNRLWWAFMAGWKAAKSTKK